MLSLDPFGRPAPDLPIGVTDYATAVRVHGDQIVPERVPGPALDGRSVAEVLAACETSAATRGLTSSDRVLSTAPWTGPSELVDGLLSVLAVGASLVQVANPDPAVLQRRIETGEGNPGPLICRDPQRNIHFRRVLGDTLCDERGLARRLPRVARRVSGDVRRPPASDPLRECEIRGDDIGGIAVHIGTRVSALAGPNDVLVSSTGLEFEERGAHLLKGVPGEWRLFAVVSA